MVDFQILATMLAALVGAFIPFLLWQTFGEEYKRNRLKESSFLDLRAELEQNQQHQETSTYISLEEDAYKRFRQSGFLSQLRTEIRLMLRELYSRIHEKNELILYHRSVLASGKEAVITDGQGLNPRKVTEIIVEIRRRIDELVGKLLPVFRRYEVAADDRSLRVERWLRRGEDACKIAALIFLVAATRYGAQIIVPISSQSTTIIETTTLLTLTSTSVASSVSACTTFTNGTKHCVEVIQQPININEYITGYVSLVVPTEERAAAEYWQSVFDALALIFFVAALTFRGVHWGRMKQKRRDYEEIIFKQSVP